MWCVEQPIDLFRQGLQVGQIHQADGAPSGLVLVGRADAALGRADLGAGAAAFAQRVEFAVDGEDQRRVLGDAQIVARDRDALLAQALDFGRQRMRIEHDAVADDRELVRAHDAGGQKRQLVDRAADDERVAGIVPALEPHDHVGLLGQPVDDLALALVAPLGAHDNHIRHRLKPRIKNPGARPGLGWKNLADSLGGSGRRGQPGIHDSTPPEEVPPAYLGSIARTQSMSL